jgi:hypothetical protein
MTTAVSGGRHEDAQKIKDPFATLASTFIPTDIKKAFRIAEKVYKGNVLILRALYKLAEYPITPLKFNALVTPVDGEEPDDDLELTGTEVEELYRKIYEEYLDFNTALIEMNLNYYLYSNDFPMLFMPFERKAVCKECLKKAKANIPADAADRSQRIKAARENLEQPLEDLEDVIWDGSHFKAKCQRCGSREREFMSRDIPDRHNYAGVSIGRLNLYRVEIQELEFSRMRRYLYSVSEQTKRNIGKNDIYSLAHEPMVVLKAVGQKKKVEYFPHAVFHFKMPSPIFERETPWAWPLIVSAFQIIFFINTLRRGAEAIAQEHISPKHYVAPAKELDSLLAEYDMDKIKDMLTEAYEEAQKDDNRAAFLPLPVTVGTLNQQGRAFLPQAEISQATRELLTGLGIAEGILTGQGPFAANSIAVRILENGFLSQRAMVQRFITYSARVIQEHFRLPPCEVGMTDFRKLDDSLHKQLVQGAVNEKRVSNRTFIKELGYDPEEEKEQIRQEMREETEFQAELEALLETKRSDMMAESQTTQMAQNTENMIAEMEKMTNSITTAVEQLEEKGYSRDWAINYVNQFMQQQTAMAEQQAAMARASEAEQAYLRDRMANATTGLNRAENQLQMHQMMDATMKDPAMQIRSEQNQVVQIARKAQLMNDDDRKRYLDHLEATQPTLHQQVVSMLGQQ